MSNFGGPSNLVSSEGKEWRKWRSAFNPGFSNSHLMTMVSQVVDDCQVFADIMNEHARNNDLFRLEPASIKLTVNIIGRLVLDLDLDAQRGRSVLLDAFSSQIRWQAQGAQFQPSELWDIRRPFVLRYNTWKMDRYITQKLDERFASRNDRGKTKYIIDLALETFRKDQGITGDLHNMKSLDPDFKRAAISNLKAFMFAGHDTTASAITYSYYFLSRYPEVLARLRKEHEDVFGPGLDSVADQLRQDPHLLNKLEYTLAVIKEVTRLAPPASTVRKAPLGYVYHHTFNIRGRLIFRSYNLHDPATGEILPTDHFMLWPVNVGINRFPKYFPNPNVFDPDRFLPGNTTDNRDAWMSFSKGPRNCIGQELAVIELKTLLAMTVRSWDLVPAYDELEKLKDDGAGYPNLTTGVLEQFGERAYQVQMGTAKPAEGLPCRLRPRTPAES